MKRDAWGVGLLSLFCILLAVIITTSTKTPMLRSPEAPSVSSAVTVPPSSDGATESPPTDSLPKQAADLPGGLWILLYGPLLMLAGLLLLLLWGSMERWRRKPAVAGFTPSDLDGFNPNAERRLVEAVKAQLVHLASGTPRNAVVACWIALEEAVAGSGLYQNPSMTSAEFAEEVLEAHTLDEQAIRRLSALYREARFSGHAITEQHRDAAAGALQTLSAELSQRVSRARRNEQPAP